MTNFSEISNNLTTRKDSLLESFQKQSGLPMDICQKLYEDTKLQLGDDTKSIEERFKQLLDVEINTFETKIDEFINSLQGIEVSNRKRWILSFLSSLEQDSDEFVFYKVLLYILYLKDNVNFKSLANTIDVSTSLNESVFDFVKTNKLYESVGINPDMITETSIPRISGVNDGSDIKEEIEFYADLKTLLARNNKRWGSNYHLDNAYEAICKYLDSEITYLTNKDNITTVDSNYHEILLRELIDGELNVMYRDVNILRTLIADLQSLVFDLMCLVLAFVRQNQRFMSYLNRKTYDEFLLAFSKLYGQIQSSRNSSILLVPYEPKDSNDFVADASSLEILENVFIDSKKFNIIYSPIKIISVVDALYIIKSCSMEFNLGIRQYINNFVTKGLEVVGKVEHIMAESAKINKYKQLY